MERLAFVDEDGQVLFDNPAGFPEDVGFTIRELAENEEWKALDDIAERLANCEQRLKHYEDLEEQGQLLRFPCAVGDFALFSDGCILPVTYISATSNGVVVGCQNGINISMNLQYGSWCKGFFKTRQEAEDKLAEMEGKNGD
ncbi:MAG: hypothetical protein HFH72_09230 [Lachnospiraceae bacterium]|nr:hypothetical protein [Lachnospiraceae bacterium]